MTEKKVIHKTLAAGRWFELSLVEQLGNIGSDVERTINWRNRGEAEYSRQAFERTLELIDLTIADPKNKKRLKEVLRARELLVDYIMYDNIYGTDDRFWKNYFMFFAYAAAVRKGR